MTLDTHRLLTASPRIGVDSALALMIFIIGIVTVYLQTTAYGVGVSPDSVNYFSTAENLAAGRGFRTFNGPLIHWPPVYPLLLALGPLAGIEPFHFVRPLNALLIAGTVAVVFAALLRLTESRTIAVAGGLALLFSPVFHVAGFAWSEVPFIALVTGSLAALDPYLRRGHAGWLLTAAMLAGLAFATRHIGVVLVAAGGLAILALAPGGVLRRLRDGIVFGAIAVGPAAAWLLRNKLVHGTATGARAPAELTVLETARAALDVLAPWVLPGSDLLERTAAAGIALLLGTGAAFLLWRHRRSPAVRRSLPALLFAVIYILAMVILRARVAFDSFDDRLFAPVFPALVLVTGVAVSCLAVELRRLGWARARRALFVILGLWTAIWPLRHGIAEIGIRQEKGAGWYSMTAWHENATLAYLDSHDLRGTIYSNAPDALCFFQDLRVHTAPPRAVAASGGDAEAAFAHLRRSLIHGQVYLVWFHIRRTPYLFGLDALRERFRLEPLQQGPAGAIFRIHSRETGKR